jgi:FkbM family methyltransferase
MEVLRLLAHYPSLLPKALFSRDEVLPTLDGLLREEFARKPVDIARGKGFEIYLSPKDVDVSPRLGVLGWIEGGTTELFTRLVRKGAYIIDIGANLGWFTLIAASIAGKEGVVLSFEPDPVNFSLLSRSVERNGFDNIRLFQQCASDVDGTRTLHMAPSEHMGQHSISRDMGGPKITVESATLDTIASNLRIDHIDVLKIDVEGAEPEVLAGAKLLLTESRIGHIIMEWNPWAWASGHERFLNSLRKLFDFYQIADSRPFPLLRRVPADMLSSHLEKNLYLRRRERAA